MGIMIERGAEMSGENMNSPPASIAQLSPLSVCRTHHGLNRQLSEQLRLVQALTQARQGIRILNVRSSEVKCDRGIHFADSPCPNCEIMNQITRTHFSINMVAALNAVLITSSREPLSLSERRRLDRRSLARRIREHPAIALGRGGLGLPLNDSPSLLHSLSLLHSGFLLKVGPYAAGPPSRCCTPRLPLHSIERALRR